MALKPQDRPRRQPPCHPEASVDLETSLRQGKGSIPQGAIPQDKSWGDFLFGCKNRAVEENRCGRSESYPTVLPSLRDPLRLAARRGHPPPPLALQVREATSQCCTPGRLHRECGGGGERRSRETEGAV